MSTVWLVATPIGNLGDLAPRAVDTLRHAALICCEDTRRTGLLLQHAGIKAQRLAVCNDHTELARIRDVLEVLGRGGDVAIVSDAGTPGISDPGERIVRAAIDAGYTVSAIPGPSAAIMAITISGLPTDRFVFEGFLPRKGRARSERLYAIGREARTIVVFEAPQRVVATLNHLVEACGPARKVAVARELTKLHEEVWRGTLEGAMRHFHEHPPRGEFVLVVEGREPVEVAAGDDVLAEAARQEIREGRSTREAADNIAERFKVSRRRAYDAVLAQRG